MSKVEACIQTFKANPNLSRKEMIELFVSSHNMTSAGASTYYSNVKRLLDGGSFHQTQPKDNIKQDTVEDDKEDDRQLYHVFTLDDNNQVDSIHSYFSPQTLKAGQYMTTDDIEIGVMLDMPH